MTLIILSTNLNAFTISFTNISEIIIFENIACSWYLDQKSVFQISSKSDTA